MGRPKKEPIEMVGNAEPVIVVENKRQKRRLEPQLSERRRIIDTKYKNQNREVHISSGVMPSNSYRCQDCRSGFAIPPNAVQACPNCKSKKLEPHRLEIVQ